MTDALLWLAWCIVVLPLVVLAIAAALAARP